MTSQHKSTKGIHTIPILRFIIPKSIGSQESGTFLLDLSKFLKLISQRLNISEIMNMVCEY